MNNKKPKTDLVKLKYFYTQTDLTIKEICEELHICYSVCKKWIKKLGLQRSKELEQQSLRKRYKVREQNLLNKYGVTNVSMLPQVQEKQRQQSLKMWENRTQEEKEELFNKVNNTKINLYGSTKYNNIEKCLQTKLNRYGNSSYNNMEKNVQTRIKNRTSGKSKEEQDLEQELINKYGKENIQKQVRLSNRSALKFDFVINNDLYIELNGEFWHNYRPFNKNNPQHLQEYYSLKERGNGIYKAVAKHWRYDDPRKLKFCMDNNINYIVLYFDKLPNNMLELVEKYKKGQTILTYKDSKLTVQRLAKTEN